MLENCFKGFDYILSKDKGNFQLTGTEQAQQHYSVQAQWKILKKVIYFYFVWHSLRCEQYCIQNTYSFYLSLFENR
jgi:hypothetical protein